MELKGGAILSNCPVIHCLIGNLSALSYKNLLESFFCEQGDFAVEVCSLAFLSEYFCV